MLSNTSNILMWEEDDMAVERHVLETVAMPEATDTYMPVAHSDLLNLFEDKLADVGFRFGEQQHVLGRSGLRYFGKCELINGYSDDDTRLFCGIRNSLDMSIRATFLLGMNVNICSNKSYFAENIVGRKHTLNIMRDLPEMVELEVQKIHVAAELNRQRIARYQGWKIVDMTADHLMVQMLRSNVINITRFPKLVKEWHEPSEDHGPKTLWRLFNAATRVLKDASTFEIPRRTLRLQKIADEVCGWREAA